MALVLEVVISGSVTADVARVLVGGTQIPIVAGRYEATVPVSKKVVAITAIDAQGREWTRTVQLDAVAGAPG